MTGIFCFYDSKGSDANIDIIANACVFVKKTRM